MEQMLGDQPDEARVGTVIWAILRITCSPRRSPDTGRPKHLRLRRSPDSLVQATAGFAVVRNESLRSGALASDRPLQAGQTDRGEDGESQVSRYTGRLDRLNTRGAATVRVTKPA